MCKIWGVFLSWYFMGFAMSLNHWSLCVLREKWVNKGLFAPFLLHKNMDLDILDPRSLSPPLFLLPSVTRCHSPLFNMLCVSDMTVMSWVTLIFAAADLPWPELLVPISPFLPFWPLVLLLASHTCIHILFPSQCILPSTSFPSHSFTS